MSSWKGTTVVHNPILIGMGVVLLLAVCVRLLVRDNRIKNDRIANGTPFVAFGSLKNWYNQSPNLVLRLARKTFSPIKEQPALDTDYLFRRDLSDFQINEIDEPTRLSIVEFVVRALGFDESGSLIRLNRTLRPGDMTELRHRAYEMRSIVVGGPINCRHNWHPRQLTHNVVLANNELDRLIALLMQDRKFVMLCIKHAGFLSNLTKSALDIAHTVNGSDISGYIPLQTTIGVFNDLQNEFYPELISN